MKIFLDKFIQKIGTHISYLITFRDDVEKCSRATHTTYNITVHAICMLGN